MKLHRQLTKGLIRFRQANSAWLCSIVSYCIIRTVEIAADFRPPFGDTQHPDIARPTYTRCFRDLALRHPAFSADIVEFRENGFLSRTDDASVNVYVVSQVSVV